MKERDAILSLVNNSRKAAEGQGDLAEIYNMCVLHFISKLTEWGIQLSPVRRGGSDLAGYVRSLMGPGN